MEVAEGAAEPLLAAQGASGSDSNTAQHSGLAPLLLPTAPMAFPTAPPSPSPIHTNASTIDMDAAVQRKLMHMPDRPKALLQRLLELM